MPIYEFECEGCHQRSEIFVRSRDEAPRCKNCGGTQLTRLLSTFAAHDKTPHEHAGSGCSCCPAGDSCPSKKK